MEKISNYRFLSLSVIFILSVLLQQVVYFNNDVSWLLEASRRLLHGGTYTNDFFENNPPLILYLYLPAVILKEFTHIHIIWSLQLYVYGLIALSLYLSNGLCSKIYPDKSRYSTNIIIFSLAVIYLLVPNRDFGQREHLLMILTMPYMLLLVARLRKIPVNTLMAASVGLMAGLGFFLKPYFLITLCLLECYYFIKTRNWQSWSRIEIRSMLALLLGYLIVVVVRHEDYISFVMPFAVSWCNATDHLPLKVMFDGVFITFFVSVSLYHLLQRRQVDQRDYFDIVLLAAFGYFVVYILEATYWTYHLYPALACLILTLLSLLAIRMVRHYSLFDYFSIALFIGSMIFFYKYFSAKLWTTSAVFKNAYLFYFSLIFGLFITVYLLKNKQERKQIYPVVLGSVLIAMLSKVFLDIVNFSDWSEYQFSIVTIFIILLYCALIILICKRKSENIATFITAIVTLALPFYMMVLYVDRSVSIKHGMSDLIAFMQHDAAHKSVYVFTMELTYAFPVITYGNETTSASRSSQFIGLGGIIRQHQEKSGDSIFLSNMVAEDIEKNKPDFVLVDHRAAILGDPYLAKNGKLGMKAISFAYLNYFEANKNFRQAWKHYTFMKKVDRFDIYRRNS